MVIPGDGIGPEVTAEAVRVLEAVSDRFGSSFEFEDALIGGTANDPRAVRCRAQPCRLPGARTLCCSAPSADRNGPNPERAPARAGPARVAQGLGVFANLRPVASIPELAAASPLKAERLAASTCSSFAS